MSRVRVLTAVVAALVATGCQSPAQMLAEEQGIATQVAARRGQFELSCQQVPILEATCPIARQFASASLHWMKPGET